MVLIGIFSPNARIEPDYTPPTTPPAAKYPTSGRTTTPPASYINTQHPSTGPTTSAPPMSMASFIPRVSFSTNNTPDLIRKIVCAATFVLNVPINILWIQRNGLNLFVLLWVLLAAFNLVCVAWGLVRLDSMTGQRIVWTKKLNRTHFDYIIMALLVTYFVIFALSMAVFVDRSYAGWLHWMWPWVIIADIVCFVAGWICAWRDASPPYLG